MPSYNLPDLFTEIPVNILSDIPDAQISGIVSDSRKAVPGCLFVAVTGSNFDGHRFIPDVVEKGAAAVVGMQPGISLEIPYVQVSDTRLALPYLAAAFFGHPGRHLTMIGVTGTDGKTTTTNLIFHVLQAAGLKPGMVSTVNAVIGDQVVDTGVHVTTPEAVEVQRFLALMVARGLTHAVLETTSHGWAQHRIDGCEFDVAVVTNITHEHLDEHGNLENYRRAKARLFQSLAETRVKILGNPKTAILNRDDGSYPYLEEICAGLPEIKVLTYAIQSEAWAIGQRPNFCRSGVSFHIDQGGHTVPIESRLVGLYNISNILAAYTATVGGLDIAPQAAQAGIARVGGIPGRMEVIDLGQDFMAIVDFAHTPNALKRVLETSRQMTSGRVIVTFGSAGLRDRQKRQLMAECAVELADLVVLTAEDPRSESLESILAEMASGADFGGGVEGKTYWRVPDRGEAIYKAISLAKPGDIVLVCGKGHEQSMCFGTLEYAWDDRIALRAALSEYLGVEGPRMPYLPTRE